MALDRFTIAGRCNINVNLDSSNQGNNVRYKVILNRYRKENAALCFQYHPVWSLVQLPLGQTVAEFFHQLER